jgi:hypothetical protein
MNTKSNKRKRLTIPKQEPTRVNKRVELSLRISNNSIQNNGPHFEIFPSPSLGHLHDLFCHADPLHSPIGRRTVASHEPKTAGSLVVETRAPSFTNPKQRKRSRQRTGIYVKNENWWTGQYYLTEFEQH